MREILVYRRPDISSLHTGRQLINARIVGSSNRHYWSTIYKNRKQAERKQKNLDSKNIEVENDHDMGMPGGKG